MMMRSRKKAKWPDLPGVGFWRGGLAAKRLSLTHSLCGQPRAGAELEIHLGVGCCFCP